MNDILVKLEVLMMAFISRIISNEYATFPLFSLFFFYSNQLLFLFPSCLVTVMLRGRRFGFAVIVLMSKRHENVKEQIVFIYLSALPVKPHLHACNHCQICFVFFFCRINFLCPARPQSVTKYKVVYLWIKIKHFKNVFLRQESSL